jgi:prevent-host-death family protein
MAKAIGVRRLKAEASRVVRSVHEEMAEYVITVRGRPVAMLKPLTEDDTQRLRQTEIADSLAEMKSLSREIGEAWTSDKSGVELIAEQRR